MAQMKTLGPVLALKMMKISDPGRIKGINGVLVEGILEGKVTILKISPDQSRIVIYDIVEIEAQTVFDRRRNISKGRGGFDVSENSGFKSRDMMRDRKSPSKVRFDRSSHGSRGHDRGFRGDDDYDGRRKGAEGGNLQKSNSPKRENFGNRERGRGNDFDNRSTRDSYFDDERHRRPQENVR